MVADISSAKRTAIDWVDAKAESLSRDHMEI